MSDLSVEQYVKYAREFGREVANLVAIRGDINAKAGVMDDITVHVWFQEIHHAVGRNHRNFTYNAPEILQALVDAATLNNRYHVTYSPANKVMTVVYRVKPLQSTFRSLQDLRTSLPTN